MINIVEAIQKSNGGIFGIECAINRLAKSDSNVITHTPRPLFIEYLCSDLKRETTANVVNTIADVFQRFEVETGLDVAVYSFLSNS